MAACGVVPPAVTSPEQPLNSAAAELKITAVTAHTHPLVLFLTSITFSGLRPAHFLGAGVGGPAEFSWSDLFCPARTQHAE